MPTPRRFPYITKLTLPAGTIDFARHIPAQEVKLIGTKAMLVARDDLPPAITNLLLDAARELHSAAGIFRSAPASFPTPRRSTCPSPPTPSRHLRFGPSFLHRYLPFFVATYLERLIVLLVPLAGHPCSADQSSAATLSLARALAHLPPVRRAEAARARRRHAHRARCPSSNGSPISTASSRRPRASSTPASYASEAYTLREHIALVRRTVQEKVADQERLARGEAA